MAGLDDNPIFSDPEDDNDSNNQGGSDDAEDVAERVRGGDSGSSESNDSGSNSSDDSGIVIESPSGGGSSGGSSSSDDSSSSSSSSSSSGGGSDPDDPSDAKNVIVSGGGSSSNPQTVVGTGDTKQEAQLDAATSGDFSADEGTQIDRLQERLGSDPLESGKNVIVTGGAGSKQEQTLVGQGKSRFQAELQAARNTRFDAAEGTRVDVLETSLGRGLGDGTQASQAFQRQNNTQKQRASNSRRKQAEKDIGFEKRAKRLQRQANRQQENRQRFENPEKFTDINTFLNPFKDNPNANFFEEATTAGVDLMQKSEEFGSKVADQTIGEINEAFTIATSPTVTDSQGNPVELSEEEKDFFQGNAAQGIERTDKFIDLGETFGGGVVQGPGVLAGFGTASVGAIPLATEQTVQNIKNDENRGPGLVEGAFTGGKLVAEDVSSNPAEFLTEEAGEEVGEAIAGALIAGPVGLAAGAAPTISPSIKTKAVESERFLRGDLGTQVETENVVTQPIPDNAESTTAFFERQTKQLENGGRAQQATRIDPAEGIVTVGQRKETPVTRRDVINTNLEAGQKQIDRFFDGNAIGSGPGALLPPEQTIDVEPETEPDTLPEQDLFKSTDPKGQTVVGQASTPEIRNTANIDASIENDIGFNQETQPRPQQGFEQENNPPIQEINQEPETNQTLDFFQEPEIRQEQTSQRNPVFDATPESKPETSITPDGKNKRSESNFDPFNFEDPGSQSTPEAAPSVDAILFDETTNEEIEDDTIFTGFETRKVQENNDLNEFI